MRIRSLREFLKSKARAFASWINKPERKRCRDSEICWINVSGAPIELTIGAYEEYDDTLMGLKRGFEGILGVVLEKETERVRQYLQLAKEFDEILAERYGYIPSGAFSTAVVIDMALAGGMSRFDFVPRAYVRPNDLDIRRSVGTKKVFIRNIIEAKFEHIMRAIAERILPPEFLSVFNSELYFLDLVGHELAHDLGLFFGGGVFRELGMYLEESKADVFGVLFLYFLADRGEIDREQADAAFVTHIIDCVRQVRFGSQEAHAIGACIQLNWLLAGNALRLENGKIVFIDRKKCKSAFDSLGKMFAVLYVGSRYYAAKAFVDAWGRGVEEFEEASKRLYDLPVDIEPVYSY